MCSGPKSGWITLCLFQSSRIGFFPCCRTSSSDAWYRIAGRSSNRWLLQQLLNAGDIEPHPGPPRKRPAPSQDLLQADILPSSAARYASALFEFEQFLAVRDIKKCFEIGRSRAVVPRRLDSALPQSFFPWWVPVRQSSWDAPCRTPEVHNTGSYARRGLA